MTSDVKMQNFLTDVTEALLVGDDVEAIRKRYGIPAQQSEELTQLIQQVHSSMREVAPAPDFSRRLKAELLDETPAGVWWQLRRLPARVQLAAMATFVGGFALFMRRRFFGEKHTDAKKKEEARVLR